MGAVTRLDSYLPTFDVHSYHELGVYAPAARAYAAMRSTDLAAHPIVRLLFAVRGLPSSTFRIEDFTRIGFVVLDEQPGREVVIAGIGQPWRPRGGVVQFSAETYSAFDLPGFAKMATSFRVTPTRGEHSLVSTETRVRCTDAAALRAFRRYWRVIGPFSGYIRRRMLSAVRAECERRG